jgi:hypothetical protein
MTGGLLTMLSNTSSDLYLTGMPQITFYKMVYRRYTHFASESVYCNFNDNIDFNKEIEIVPQRVGDLLYKTYLHIVLPEIVITKQDVGINVTNIGYNIDIEKYMKLLTSLYRIVYNSLNIYNLPYASVLNECIDYYDNNDGEILLNEYNNLLSEHKFDRSSNVWYVLQNINISNLEAAAQQMISQTFIIGSEQYNNEIQRLLKMLVFNELTKSIEKCKEVQKYFNTKYIEYMNRTNNIKCAWVKNLGHSIIEYIDVVIGGNRIDRHYGIWINIWYQLTYKQEQVNAYNEIIGNVPQLTEFNDNMKPKYDLYIPLSFWFNKFNGNAFPIIALQHTDLHMFIKLRKFEELFYTEKIYSGMLNMSNVIITANMINNSITNITEIKDINLSSLWYSKGKQLYGHLLIDYIYLSSEERKRYAQSGHEYLIENIQTNRFDVNNNIFDARLDFVNPSKELIWVLTRDCLTNNENSYTECRWYDHTLDTKGNPILNASITFNTYTRVSTQPGIYFNKYQPYTFHKVSPDDGINIYSFSLEPLQHQPTGTCNFSRLNDVKLILNIDKKYFRYTEQQLYKYDENIDFEIIIDSQELIDKIDIDYAREIMDQTTIDTYEYLSNNNNILLSVYKKLILKTKVECIVFSVSINILRLIGGYGALAYTGNS